MSVYATSSLLTPMRRMNWGGSGVGGESGTRGLDLNGSVRRAERPLRAAARAAATEPVKVRSVGKKRESLCVCLQMAVFRNSSVARNVCCQLTALSPTFAESGGGGNSRRGEGGRWKPSPPTSREGQKGLCLRCTVQRAEDARREREKEKARVCACVRACVCACVSSVCVEV